MSALKHFTVIETGAILLDTRLEDSLDKETITGYGRCKDCNDKYGQGYVALVEADPTKSKMLPNGNVDFNNAHRTGVIVHMRKHVFTQVFNCPAPKEFAFIDPQAVAMLQKMMGNENQG